MTQNPTAPPPGLIDRIKTLVGAAPRPVSFAALAWMISGVLSVLLPIVSLITGQLQRSQISSSANSYDPLTGALTDGFLAVGAAFSIPQLIGLFLGSLVGLVGYGFISYFTLKGSQPARVIATILTVLSLFTLFNIRLVGVPAVLPILLNFTGMVMVFLPESNAFFAHMRAMKPRAVYFAPAAQYPQQPMPMQPMQQMPVAYPQQIAPMAQYPQYPQQPVAVAPAVVPYPQQAAAEPAPAPAAAPAVQVVEPAPVHTPEAAPAAVAPPEPAPAPMAPAEPVVESAPAADQPETETPAQA